MVPLPLQEECPADVARVIQAPDVRHVPPWRVHRPYRRVGLEHVEGNFGEDVEERIEGVAPAVPPGLHGNTCDNCEDRPGQIDFAASFFTD